MTALPAPYHNPDSRFPEAHFAQTVKNRLRKAFPIGLLIVQRNHAGQCLAFKVLQARAAACGHMTLVQYRE